MVEVAVRQSGKSNIRANAAKLGMEKTKAIGVRVLKCYRNHESLFHSRVCFYTLLIYQVRNECIL